MRKFAKALEAYQTARASIEAAGGKCDVDRTVDRLVIATSRLMGTRAPSLTALVIKLRVAMAECPTPSGGGMIEAHHAAELLKDAQRLAA